MTAIPFFFTIKKFDEKVDENAEEILMKIQTRSKLLAEQSRAEQSRAEQSRAEQSRALI